MVVKASPPPPIGRRTFFVASALALLPCLDQVHLWIRARTAPVAHLAALPPILLWGPLLLAVLAVVVRGGRALGVTDPLEARWTRLPMLAAALVLFLFAFVTGPTRPPLGKFEAALTIETFAAVVRSQTTAEHLPDSVEELTPLMAELGEPGLWVGGVAVPAWRVVVREGCDGPITDPAGFSAGTLLMCIDAAKRKAFLSGVGLSSDLWGAPEILSFRKHPIVEEVVAADPVQEQPEGIDVGEIDPGAGAPTP